MNQIAITVDLISAFRFISKLKPISMAIRAFKFMNNFCFIFGKMFVDWRNAWTQLTSFSCDMLCSIKIMHKLSLFSPLVNRFCDLFIFYLAKRKNFVWTRSGFVFLTRFWLKCPLIWINYLHVVERIHSISRLRWICCFVFSSFLFVWFVL